VSDSTEGTQYAANDCSVSKQTTSRIFSLRLSLRIPEGVSLTVSIMSGTSIDVNLGSLN